MFWLARLIASRVAWALALLVGVGIAGCGSHATAPSTVPADTITFSSGRALDGSDAANNAGTRNIWVVNPDGSGAKPLTTLANADSANPAWSPDGSKIAFDSARAFDGSDAANSGLTKNIWIMNAAGSSQIALTKISVGFADSTNPVWSPDGRKIAFQSGRALDGSNAANTSSTQNIWVINADGSGPTPLTRLTSGVTEAKNPLWSPDGTRIAFQSARALDGSDAANVNQTLNVWLMNADGSGQTPLTKLTAKSADSLNPAWSPDGSKIAFESVAALDGSNAANTNLQSNVWVVKADGSSPAPLTRLTAASLVSAVPIHPAWSPDGSKIVYESMRSLEGSNLPDLNTINLWVINADGSATAPLTALGSGAQSLEPRWSPGGGKLFFASQRALDGRDAFNANSTFNIWVLSTDGSSRTPLTKITALGGDSRSPRQP